MVPETKKLKPFIDDLKKGVSTGQASLVYSPEKIRELQAIVKENKEMLNSLQERDVCECS